MALFVPALLFVVASVAQQPSRPAQQENSQTVTQHVVANVDPPVQKDLERLFEDVGMDQLLRFQADQMMAPTAAMLRANPQFTPQLVDEFVRRSKEKLLDGRVQDLVIQVYAKAFTADEIQQMIAYQESPVGRKAKQLMPQLMAEVGLKAKAMGDGIAKEVAMEVIRDHPEYLRKPAPDAAAAGGVIGGVVGGIATAPPPPPRPFTGQRVDGKVQEARLVKKVGPDYPPLAKSARVQGIVRFTAVIGTDGKVESLTLVSGHPLLVNAAREAVMQWEYEPVVLNGKPVEVTTDIEVNFHLEP